MRPKQEQNAKKFNNGQRRPGKNWQNTDDLAPRMAKFPHLIKAGTKEAYERAFGLVEEIEPYLFTWGQYLKLVEMREKLLGKLEGSGELLNRGNLGKTYIFLGRAQEALELSKEAWNGFKKKNDLKNKGRFLGWRGWALLMTGQLSEAIASWKDALEIARADEVKDMLYATWWLNSLGWTHLEAAANHNEALKYLKESAAISKDMYDAGQLNIWGLAVKELVNTNLGKAYNKLGHNEKASELLDGAISAAGEIGDRNTVLLAHRGKGDCCRSRFQKESAREQYQKGLKIAKEIGIRIEEIRVISRQGNLHRDQGFYQDISGNQDESLEFYTEAVATYQKGIDIGIGNDPEIRVLHGRKGNVQCILGSKGQSEMYGFAAESLGDALKMAGPNAAAKAHTQLDLVRNDLRASKIEDVKKTFEEHMGQNNTAPFGLGNIFFEDMDPEDKAPGVVKKLYESCQKKIDKSAGHTLKHPKPEAELHYLKALLLAIETAMAKKEGHDDKQKAKLYKAVYKLDQACKIYKSPDLLRDTYYDLLLVQQISGHDNLLKPLIDLLREETKKSVEGEKDDKDAGKGCAH